MDKLPDHEARGALQWYYRQRAHLSVVHEKVTMALCRVSGETCPSKGGRKVTMAIFCV